MRKVIGLVIVFLGAFFAGANVIGLVPVSPSYKPSWWLVAIPVLVAIVGVIISQRKEDKTCQ